MPESDALDELDELDELDDLDELDILDAVATHEGQVALAAVIADEVLDDFSSGRLRSVETACNMAARRIKELVGVEGIDECCPELASVIAVAVHVVNMSVDGVRAEWH